MFTDKLTAHDLRIVSDDGEPRFRDVRLGGRLGYSRAEDIRQLIERYREYLERLSTLRYRAVKSIGGRPATECWLNEAQTFFIIAKSEAKNALEILLEVVEAHAAYRRGERPSEPLTDALLAPDKPTIEHDGNIVRPNWKQPDLFAGRNTCETFEVTASGQTGRAVVTYNDSETPTQIAIEQTKTDQETFGLYHDNAAVLTIMLQHGVPLETIRDAIGRNEDGKAATLIGSLLEKLCPP